MIFTQNAKCPNCNSIGSLKYDMTQEYSVSNDPYVLNEIVYWYRCRQCDSHLKEEEIKRNKFPFSKERYAKVMQEIKEKYRPGAEIF